MATKDSVVLDSCLRAIEASLKQHGIDQGIAFKAALDAVTAMQDAVGGQYVYMTKRRVPSDVRSTEVYLMRQDGKSIAEIAKHFGYSVIWVYALLRREKDLIDAQARKELTR